MDRPVFISYSNQDAQFVQQLEDSLMEASISTWRDKSRLKAGDQWSDEIARALESATTLILVLSPDAVKSSWVKKELYYAVTHNKRIIPVVTEETDLPPGYKFLLGACQSLDFINQSYTDAVNSLVDVISQLKSNNLSDKIEKTSIDGAFSIYIEDIIEFIPHIPRMMLWHIMSMHMMSVTNRVIAIQILRPFGFLLFFLIAYLIHFPIILVMVGGVHIFFMGFSFSSIIMASIVMDVVITLISTITFEFIKKEPRKKMLTNDLMTAANWIPHRPLEVSQPNMLIKHWNRIETIIWQLLEQPDEKWIAYISEHCRDVELSRRVYATIIVLLQLGYLYNFMDLTIDSVHPKEPQTIRRNAL